MSAHVYDWLITCKSKDITVAFKKEILTRSVGTYEGEVTEYLGCDLIRNRSAKTAILVQRVYAERVLKTFGMWDCKPCATPLDANSRLSKMDCRQVVDTALHRRYRSITGCLSYLVNMTRPRPRVCILSTEQIPTISRSSTFGSCRAGIVICTWYS